MGKHLIALLFGSVFIIALAFLGIQRAYVPPRGAVQVEPETSVTFPSGTATGFSSSWYVGGIKNRDFSTGIYTAAMNLRMPAGWDAKRETDDYILVFPSIDGNAIRVFLNGQFIGSSGDFARGNSNIWYAAKFISVPRLMLTDHNTITAQILGLYEAGISHLPYLVRVSANKFHLAWLSFLTRRLVILLTGSILVLGFILLFTRVEKTVLSNSRLILGLASFLTALFLTDFMNLEYLPFTLLAFKKIVVIARHVASIVFMLGFLQLIERKLDFFSRLFIAIQMLCSLVLLYPPTVHLLKQFYTFTYLTLIPMPLYLLYLLFNKSFKKRAYSILLCGVALATCAGVRDAIIPLLYPGATYYSHFGFMLLIISASWFIVLDELNHFRLFMQERSKSEQYRKESQQDPLTGVYNRSMLEAARSNLHSDYSIIIIDIDDLKEINDTFGHPTGDFVLRNLASRIQNLVRYDDLIIRYGGDEFLAILPRCSTERLVLLETRFRDEFARTQIPMSDGRELAYSVSVGSAHVSSLDKPSLNALDEAIIRADTRMYDNKRMKKRVEG